MLAKKCQEAYTEQVKEYYINLNLKSYQMLIKNGTIIPNTLALRSYNGFTNLSRFIISFQCCTTSSVRAVLSMPYFEYG